MRLRIPLTGTVLVEGSVWGKGELKGDDNDPIRPVRLNLDNVSWVMVDVDMENEEMIIEVTPLKIVGEPVLDENGRQKVINGRVQVRRRIPTENERAGFLEKARQKVEGHTREELYAMSGSPRLKRPFKK